MPHFEVRTLTSGDVELMHGMLSLFGEAFGDAETYGARRPGPVYLERLLQRDHFIALTVCEGGRVVGALAAYALEKFEQERSEIYIYDLAVAVDRRRQGIANALIAKLQKIAATRGAYVILVQADHGDDAAIALYAGLGTGEEVLHFDIPVLRAAPPE